MIPLIAPHTTATLRDRFFRLHAEVARNADHIVVVSEATRRDVISILDVPEDRVTNTYQCVSLDPAIAERPIEQVDWELRQTFDLGWKDYFLHFGAIEPKKNLGRIVDAYLASHTKRPLVIVGGRGWMQEDELATLNQIRANNHFNAERIIVFDYMTQHNLINLIRGARAMLFPSLYEGFGLPVLEAQTLGTAVLTSNAGSLPEVAGDAALTVEPESVDQIRKGIDMLDNDDALVESLKLQGRVQAAKFSPEAYRTRLKEWSYVPHP
ncbi:hypothetical protein LTR94_024094 [Friedmanniomyces endolithicus]|nr:hypothetical protein LTR94_024094 [Friedmanniomyces endolithicus]